MTTVHLPALQTCEPEHTVPQAPQSVSEVCRFTQVSAPLACMHASKPFAQLRPQRPETQVAVPPVIAGHCWQLAPHCRMEVSDTQLPLQSCVPAGHALTQLLPSQLTVPPSRVPWQGVQAVPHVLTSVLLTQLPLQACVPVGQVHLPLTHISPDEHIVPQAPQWLLSLVRSTQLLPHIMRLLGQLKPQLVPLQVAAAPAGAVHGVQDVPQVAGDVLLTHAPLQTCWPFGQPHLPALQVWPAGQLIPHAPQ